MLSDNRIKKRREDYLGNAYDYIYNSMKDQLEKEKGPLSPQVLADIKTKLNKHRSLNRVDIKYLHTLRQIEEEVYYKEQK